MRSFISVVFGSLLLMACGGRPSVDQRNVDLANQVGKQHALVNLCIKNGSYLDDTIQLTPWDSNDTKTYCYLIFKDKNKLSATSSETFSNTSIGLDSRSSFWSVNDKTGLVLLDIKEKGLADHSRLKAEYKIEDYSKEGVRLVKTNTLLDE